MPTITDNALETFLVDHQDRFYRLAYSYLRHPEDAMDAVQTAVCRAIERQDRLRNPAFFRSWFYRILVNVCLDALRRRGRFVPLTELMDIGREDPPPADELLFRQIDALPQEVSTVIKLRVFEDLSLKEISVVTGCNINTVKSRLYSGLKKLKLSLEGADLV